MAGGKETGMSKTEIFFRITMSALAISAGFTKDWVMGLLSLGIVWAIWSNRGELGDDFPLASYGIPHYIGGYGSKRDISQRAIPPFLKEVAMLLKFSTLAGGVFIEQTGADERRASDRCFRFDAKGNAEYTFFADLISNNPAPRWFGHVYKERDFLFA